MAYQEVNDLSVDNATALGGVNRKTGKKNPTTIEGYYLGSRKTDSPKAKSGFAYIHVFQTKTGNQGIWGKTDLDRKILAVNPGTMTCVTFTGMLKTPNGEMYKFKVQFDASNTIEVGGWNDKQDEDQESDDNAPSNSYGGGSDDEETGDNDDVQEDTYRPSKVASSSSAEDRRAKVQALIGKGKNK